MERNLCNEYFKNIVINNNKGIITLRGTFYCSYIFCKFIQVHPKFIYFDRLYIAGEEVTFRAAHVLCLQIMRQQMLKTTQVGYHDLLLPQKHNNVSWNFLLHYADQLFTSVYC